ncbi:hypothetical protein JW935_10015 [candidate division KSB1 bacterium]|nr:hypothetical protein [candidate division KSB1 bacterium]
MKLAAAFWDYPQFTDAEYLRQTLEQHKGGDIYLWLLHRLLEHGRVVDVFEFSVKESPINAKDPFRFQS